MHSKTQLDGDPHLPLCTCRDPIAAPQTLHRNQLSAVSIVHFLRSGIRCGMAKNTDPFRSCKCHIRSVPFRHPHFRSVAAPPKADLPTFHRRGQSRTANWHVVQFGLVPGWEDISCNPRGEKDGSVG